MYLIPAVLFLFVGLVLWAYIRFGTHDEEYRRERVEQGQADEYTDNENAI